MEMGEDRGQGAEDFAAGEDGGHRDSEEAVEIEALAGEIEVAYRSPGREDRSGNIGTILPDTERRPLRGKGITPVSCRSTGIYFPYGIP